MKKNSMIITIMIIVLILVLIWIYFAMKNGQNNNVPAQTQTSQSNTTTPQLFSDSPLSQNAYLISTATYDANTQKALTGFTVTKNTLADGSMQVTLNAQIPGYQTQTYTVKPGEKLYFIEGMQGDDSGNADKNGIDDSAILVDASGYIVTQ